MVHGEISLSVASEDDILTARQKGRWLAEEVGFRGSESILLSTLISQLARRVYRSTRYGSVQLRTIERGNRKGITVVISGGGSRNQNKGGLGDAQGLRDFGAYASAWRSLAVQYVTDEFEVRAAGEKGTVVRFVKWLAVQEESPSDVRT